MGELALKYHGTHGDHAEDQKSKHRLLAVWKDEMSKQGLGARHLLAMPENERNTLVLEDVTRMIHSMGGEAVWNALSSEERLEHEMMALKNLAESFAGDAFLALPEVERRQTRVFVWAGCGMHKELNSVKGGDTAMCNEWKNHEMSPILLANKDNAAVLELAGDKDEDLDGVREGTAAEKRARDVSKAGGVKLASLVRALLNHRDDKKGQHHTFWDYAQMEMGRTFTFPDTSNTRYSSYLEAVAELLANQSAYIDYMCIICFSKDRPALNNLETNVLKGLEDLPTLTELACLALYREAVSVSYIASVRGCSLEDVNALDLRPLLQKVKSHVKKLIDAPQLILSPDADLIQVTLNGFGSWSRPDAVESIQSLQAESKLPKLECLFKAFLTGALATWERFSSEFNDDGLIAALTEAEKETAWMPATNNANEGALGSYRVFTWKNPNGSVKLFNTIFRYRRNDTEDFIQTVLAGDDQQSFLRKQAQAEDEMCSDRKRRREVHEERMDEAATKKQKYDLRTQKRSDRDEHLRSIEIQDDCEVVKKMTVSELKDQLAKLRKVDKSIPRDSKMSRKADKLACLLAALERHRAHNKSM